MKAPTNDALMSLGVSRARVTEPMEGPPHSPVGGGGGGGSRMLMDLIDFSNR